MKKILLVSHCVLNSYCENPPAASTYRRQILEHALENDISIVQLPCPELTYQALDRSSIYPGTKEAEAYEEYCRELIAPVIANIKEYAAHDICIAGIVGVDTSPSCSVIDKEAIMMKLLLKELEENGIGCGQLNDMPV